MLEQPEIRLDVTGFVPDLARHVETEFPRRIRKIVDRPPGALHRLQLAHHNAVHALTDRLAAREIRERRQALLDLERRDAPRTHADEAVLAGELFIADGSVHTVLLRTNGSTSNGGRPAHAKVRHELRREEQKVPRSVSG